MSSTPNAIRNGRTTRERILYEASVLFVRRGYFGTSTRQIAQAAGIRQPSLFHHFSSKEEIAQALLSFSLDGPSEYAVSLARSRDSAARRLYSYIRFDARHLCRSPYNLGGLHGDDVMNTRGFEHQRAQRDAIRESVKAMVADGMRSREFVAIDAELARTMVTNLLLSVTTLFSAARQSLEDVPDALAAFALRGLLADPALLETLVGPDLQP
jgi:AcrR family transcriptional regulator